MKKIRFFLLVIGVLLIGYFIISITNGVGSLFVGDRGEQATSLTKTGQGNATTIINNADDSSKSKLNDSSKVKMASFSEEKVKTSMLPVMEKVFKHSVEVQNKIHVPKDSEIQEKSFDSKVITDAVFSRVISDISTEEDDGDAITVNGMKTKINKSDSVYKFGNVSVVGATQQGELAQITGTFNYSVDDKSYTKEFSAFTDSSYSKVTEINLQ